MLLICLHINLVLTRMTTNNTPVTCTSSISTYLIIFRLSEFMILQDILDGLIDVGSFGK